MKEQKHILITGSHRSGSTWVGKMIASSKEVIYIHEPFNKNNHICPECGIKNKFWFPYVFSNIENDYKKHVQHILLFNYNHINKLKEIRNYVSFKKFIQSYFNYFLYNISQKKVIIKDPIALFSAEWLAKTFDLNVLVLIRHPAAFAGSLKLKNWTHDFSDFLKQHELMKDLLYPFKDEITAYSKKKRDIIDQSILLWRIVHYVIMQYQRKHPEWIFIKHEDISQNPIKHFKDIFKTFNLNFSIKVEKNIIKHSGNKTSQKKDLIRDSKTNILAWKKRLTESEIDRIKKGTKDISPHFYSEDEW